MKIKSILYYLTGFVLLCAILLAASPYYVREALIHQLPGIVDYRIFANREVRAGNPHPWKISSVYNHYDLTPRQEKDFCDYKTVSFLVIRNDSLLFEKYWDNFSDSSLSNSFSVSKSIIGLLTGIAIDEGRIKSVNQPVYEFLPQFGTSASDRQLTIRDLLTMSSGLNWDESYSSLFSKTTEAYYGNDLLDLTEKLHVVEKPGKKFRYLSGNTMLLAFILRKATGKTLSQYASEKLWIPLGAEHTALWSLDHKDGYEKGYCCFNTGARDFARIGQLVLNHGTWDGKTIVSRNYIDRATAPDTFLSDNRQKPVDFYGYQWWILHYQGYRIPYARGILGQYIFVIPGKNAVIVRLGKKKSKDHNIHQNDIFLYLKTAFEIMDKQ